MSKSNENHSGVRNEQTTPFPEWMLTAFALGELEPTESTQVKSAIEADPKLQAELTAIRGTLGKIESTFKSSAHSEVTTQTERAVSLTRSQTEKVRTAIAQSKANNSLANSPLLANRKRWMALLATAASIPVGLLVWSSFQAGRVGKESLSFNPRTQDLSTRLEPSGVKEFQMAPDTNAPAENRRELAESESLRSESDAIAVATSSSSPAVAEQAVLSFESKVSVDNFQDKTNLSPAKDEKGQAMTMPATKPTASAPMSGIRGGGMGGGAPSAPPITTPPRKANFADGDSKRMRAVTDASPANSSSIDELMAMGPGGGYGGGMGMGSGYGGPAGGGYGGEVGGYGSGLNLERSGYGYGMPMDAPYPPNLPEELKKNLRRYPTREAQSADRFDTIFEKPFSLAKEQPVTTFSVDVDTASYSKIRQTLEQTGQLPSPNMVRIEEMINSFEYSYPSPNDGSPFSANMKIVPCPWNTKHQLVRIGVQAKRIQAEERPRCNLVFLIDVSGSMNQPNKLPLVQRSLAMLTSNLRPEDRVSIVVYAGAAGCVLESTSGRERAKIQSAIDNLQAGGSTNGGQGIQLAYSIARENFIPGGANRVILCTDGDFNVGVTGTEQLVEMMKENAKSNVYLTCLGYGMGNYNDSMMEKISKDGNGFYGMVDNDREARRIMIEQLSGTLVTVAKDVKLQVDFNPELVRAYRIIGYEDRQLANADFTNDKKDAGDIGAGHSVTAFYEIVPASLEEPNTTASAEQSKYARKNASATTASTVEPKVAEWLSLKIRTKQPEASTSTEQEFVLPFRSGFADENKANDRDMSWATAVAEFGLLLRRSSMAPDANWDRMIEKASTAASDNEHRQECVRLMRRAKAFAQQ